MEDDLQCPICMGVLKKTIIVTGASEGADLDA
jgi:hypothetical protein